MIHHTAFVNTPPQKFLWDRINTDTDLEYLKAHSDIIGLDADVFKRWNVHVHVPEGATPKDGPSAGVTMASALLSLARSEQPRALAMTGELTLTGQVLAIGGVREKVIAARRVGIDELILPEANRGDFDELPEHIRAGITVHFASTYADVAKRLFAKKKTEADAA